MAHRHLLERLDRLLQDLMIDQRPFGGKTIILAGDFHQILPVFIHGARSHITSASFKQSKLWKHFQIWPLQENMCVGADPSLKPFDDWLLKMGNGELQVKELPDKIEIPIINKMLFNIDDSTEESKNTSLMKFVHLIFPNMNAILNGQLPNWIQWLSECAILAPKYSTVDTVNNVVVSQCFVEQENVFFSVDTTTNPDDGTRFPVEYLQSLTPAGLPPHRLILK